MLSNEPKSTAVCADCPEAAEMEREAGAFSRIVTPAVEIWAIGTVMLRGTSVTSVAIAPVACSMFQSSVVIERSYCAPWPSRAAPKSTQPVFGA
jgi:hypothetical protein